MATLAPRPGPAVIQRANSLQASDTSHTSHTSTASTTSTTDASTNTSASHSKPSPVSSIGESISSVVHQPVLHLIPPARSARPLPIPPSLSPPTSPGLTSTSTLKLSHQESQSTLGKSSQANLHKPTSNSTVLLTKSKNAPARKPSRVRPDPDAVTQSPPPSAFLPRRMSDDGWVSVSVMPVLTERQPDGRLHEPNHSSYAKPSAVSSGKRSASASRAAKSAAKPASGSAKSAARTASKSLPRLPQSDSPASRPPPPPQPQDNAWKLEFRGVVRLVRWVSRRDKDKRDSAVWDVNENDIPDHDGTQDEKLVVEEIPAPASRKGFSISNEARRSRDSYKQPAPNRNAPPGGLGPVKARPSSMVRLQPKLEGENDGNTKRRLSKSNPGLVNFVLGSTTSDRTEISQRTRTSTDAGIRRSVDTGRRTSSDAGLGLGISSNGGGVFVPDAPLNVPATDAHPPRSSSLHAATSVLHTFDANVTSPNAGLSGQAEMSADISQTDRFGEGDDTITFLPGAPFSSLPYRQGPISSASQVTTVTRTTTAHTTTTVVQTPPFSITSPQSLLPATTHSYALSTSHSTLSPVLEAPLFSSELAASPPEIGAGAGGFPWNGMNRGVVQVGEIVPSESVIFRGGLEAAAAATHVTTQLDNAQVETVVTEVVGPAPIAAMDAFRKSVPSVAANSVSTTSSSSGSLSPLASTSASVSPLMSNSVSPLMSAVASASASPVIPSNAHLSDPYMSAYTPATTAASSLSYATARSNRNSLPAAQAIFENHAGGLQTTVDPVMFEQPGRSNEASYVLRTGASTDIGHGCSTRATSPSPSDRYAFSEDPHGSRPSGGILRTLSSIGHSDAPLPMPRRPFLPGRGSSGSVTFDDSSTQSSPRLGGRRKMMTMSASDVRQSDRLSAFLNGNHYANTRSPRPEVHRSKSSLSITGRIIRRLSIGSSSNAPKSNGAESETDRPRVTRKLTRRKSQGRTGNGSSVSLPYADGLNSVPPVPPLPPGVSSGNFGRRAQSEVGHGALSDIGHGVQSEIGHGYGHSRGDSLGGHSTWEGSTSVLGHESTTSHAISPAPTRVSFTTTQSAPASSYGRNKLVKKNRRAPRRVTESDALRRSLASVEYPNEPVSRDPPRITTEFEHARLSLNGNSLSAGTDGVTDEGHLMPPRPGMPRRTSSQRRWTIADIDDDEFLRQLEAKLSGTGSRLRKSRVLEEFAMGADQSHEDPEAEIEPDPGSETDDSAAEREWIKARRAMMCVREIVRTEKSYLRHMVGFSEGNESMSPILLEHIPRLIETSRTFMARLEEDPSAWGVSSAFLDVEEQLEAAFVEWSGVVGHVILSKSSKAESQAPSEDGHTSSAGSGSAASSWMRRRSATASSSSAQPFQLNLSMTPVIGSKGKKSNRSANSKRLTEQDWAIMPTQRVLRYVMMYRELLHYTPAKSASRPLVERALQGATRIAQLCNDAQTHVDILSPS